MKDIISTESLSKRFGKVQAVNDLSLNIREGEIYGFLGLNGAGKTTTIRMLLGMIRPTSGASYIYGRQVRTGSNEIWKNIGYLVEVPYSYPDLSVRENLEIICRMRYISDKNAVGSIIDKLHLSEYTDRKAKNLSQGNAQRLGLAKALMHNPQILLLDEPTNGLDPAGIVEIRELLIDMVKNKGVTVFISSHILGEISKMTSRIGIINEGRLIQEVDTAKLDRLLHKRLLLNASDKSAAKEILGQMGYSANVTEEGILETKNEYAIDHPDEIASLLVKNGIPPTLLKVEEEDLESYFLRIIGMKGEIK
jgi:ABC-2 type transport system ATP-binding protein